MKNIILVTIFVLCCMTFQSQAVVSNALKNRVRRIVNGERSLIIQHPWVVEIDKDPGNKIYLGNQIECGGSIINDEWVLTAARCFDEPQNPGKYTVRDGSVFLEKGNKHTVVNIVIHEDFDQGSSRNDIALVKVTPNFKFDRKTQPVKLPEPGTKVEDRTVVSVAGHGEQERTGKSELLYEITMLVISNEECQKKVPGNKPKILPTHLCLNFPEEKKCARWGDHGDPVTTKDNVLEGIVARFYPCGFRDKPSPTVCTRVSEYVDWINNITESSV